MFLHLALAAFLFVAQPPVQQAEQVITAVPNVRLRAAPSLSAKVLREDPLGTVYRVIGRTPDGWLQVDAFGDSTYVREELTTPVTPATRAAVVERIISTRIERSGTGFAEWNQLLYLIGGHSGADRETTARFALFELKALGGAADTAGGAFRTRFAFRLADQSDVFVNHEPAGQWILRRDYILAVHDRFRDTAAADDIAWFAAENGLPGECEGYLPCYVTMLDRLQGEYLRRHPGGRHASAALARIAEVLAYFDPPKIDDTGLPAGTICGDLRAPLVSLSAAVAKAPASADALRPLTALQASCGPQTGVPPWRDEARIRARLQQPIARFDDENAFLWSIWHESGERGDREANARFAYYRLEALRRTAAAASREQVFNRFFVELLGQESTLLAYIEMYGAWEVRRDYLRGVQETFKGTNASDDLAWLDVAIGWGGECQDHIMCPVTVLDDLVGAYLRAYPSGRHVEAAMEQIARWLDFQGREPFSIEPEMPKALACGQIESSLAALTRAVASSTAANKTAALAPLEQLEAACR